MKRQLDPRGLVMVGIALVVIALDQYVKEVVRRNLPLNQSWMPIAWLDPIVTLTYVRNTGAAFGLFPSMGPLFAIVAIAVVIIVIVFYRQLSAASWVLRLAFGLQLGGAVGNMIDRLTVHYVTDYIDFRIWPIWNIADGAVVVGTCLLAYYALFVDRPKPTERPALNPTSAPDDQPTTSGSK
jgi:signal peptidase II